MYILQQKKKWTIEARKPESAGKGSNDQGRIRRASMSPHPEPRSNHAEIVAKSVVRHSKKKRLHTRNVNINTIGQLCK